MSEKRLDNLTYEQLLEDFVELYEYVLLHPEDEEKLRKKKEILWVKLLEKLKEKAIVKNY